MNNLSQEQQKKLEEIARHLGSTIQQLLETHNNPQQIIEEYERGNLRVLND